MGGSLIELYSLFLAPPGVADWGEVQPQIRTSVSRRFVVRGWVSGRFPDQCLLPLLGLSQFRQRYLRNTFVSAVGRLVWFTVISRASAFPAPRRDPTTQRYNASPEPRERSCFSAQW